MWPPKRKEGAEIQSALDRRQAMLELLSDRRQETVANLMAEFGVSRCTVLRDIDALSCSAPIYTVQGNGGGVRVVDGYYYERRSAGVSCALWNASRTLSMVIVCPREGLALYQFASLVQSASSGRPKITG